MASSLMQLTPVFLKIGNTTFGGGDPTIMALQRELVVRRAWLVPSDFALAYSLARVTPGTNMLAFCAGAGWFLRGWLGALAAVLAVTLPSAILVLWLTNLYALWNENVFAKAAIAGTLAAAVGMMAAGAWLLVRSHTTNGEIIRSLLIVTGALLLRTIPLSPIQILALAAILGFFWRRPHTK